MPWEVAWSKQWLRGRLFSRGFRTGRFRFSLGLHGGSRSRLIFPCRNESGRIGAREGFLTRKGFRRRTGNFLPLECFRRFPSYEACLWFQDTSWDFLTLKCFRDTSYSGVYSLWFRDTSYSGVYSLWFQDTS
jgi:hypothetical protein